MLSDTFTQHFCTYLQSYLPEQSNNLLSQISCTHISSTKCIIYNCSTSIKQPSSNQYQGFIIAVGALRCNISMYNLCMRYQYTLVMRRSTIGQLVFQSYFYSTILRATLHIRILTVGGNGHHQW